MSGNYQVFNAFGQLMATARNTNRIDVSRLPAGTYILRYPAANASKVFVKQ
ncbi:MAG: T9SS type A sorting domain-containing protein [Haliscomenobacter sp.]|nr:T9SS type A sorting domain-containing protein [Haliscomenobacter sp.]